MLIPSTYFLPYLLFTRPLNRDLGKCSKNVFKIARQFIFEINMNQGHQSSLLYPAIVPYLNIYTKVKNNWLMIPKHLNILNALKYILRGNNLSEHWQGCLPPIGTVNNCLQHNPLHVTFSMNLVKIKIITRCSGRLFIV